MLEGGCVLGRGKLLAIVVFGMLREEFFGEGELQGSG
jgi:hypothetical protein